MHQKPALSQPRQQVPMEKRSFERMAMGICCLLWLKHAKNHTLALSVGNFDKVHVRVRTRK